MGSRIGSLNELAVKEVQDSELASKIKQNPAEAIADIAAQDVPPDVWIYRMVVGFLGLAVLAGIIGAIILSMAGKPTPEVLVALGSAAVGALAGLLAPSPTKS